MPKITFNKLPLGAVYHVGDTFAEGKTNIEITRFQWPDKTTWAPPHGFAWVSDQNLAGGSAREIVTNNVNLGFVFPEGARHVDIDFGYFGGNVNIWANRKIVNFSGFHKVPKKVDGIKIIPTMKTRTTGTLCLDGEMELMRFQRWGEFHLVIGGQEFAIDNVVYTV